MRICPSPTRTTVASVLSNHCRAHLQRAASCVARARMCAQQSPVVDRPQCPPHLCVAAYAAPTYLSRARPATSSAYEMRPSPFLSHAAMSASTSASSTGTFHSVSARATSGFETVPELSTSMKRKARRMLAKRALSASRAAPSTSPLLPTIPCCALMILGASPHRVLSILPKIPRRASASSGRCARTSARSHDATSRWTVSRASAATNSLYETVPSVSVSQRRIRPSISAAECGRFHSAMARPISADEILPEPSRSIAWKALCMSPKRALSASENADDDFFASIGGGGGFADGGRAAGGLAEGGRAEGGRAAEGARGARTTRLTGVVRLRELVEARLCALRRLCTLANRGSAEASGPPRTGDGCTTLRAPWCEPGRAGADGIGGFFIGAAASGWPSVGGALVGWSGRRPLTNSRHWKRPSLVYLSSATLISSGDSRMPAVCRKGARHSAGTEPVPEASARRKWHRRS
mmetsp:Transcript_74504/g.223979  ORF Transcript_74504/g.223979 Transcript_74504/m.223979 type:complete len:467 (-) Transcript_74504:56-1456(-)